MMILSDMPRCLSFTLVLSFALGLLHGCDPREHAPYGSSGGGGGGGGGGDVDTDTDVDSDTESESDSEASTCMSEEVYDELNNRCWLRCPVGQDWDGDSCLGISDLGDADWAFASCQAIMYEYHPPTLNEMTSLLGGCDIEILDSGLSGYCDPCYVSDICAPLFGEDFDYYWTSTRSLLDGSPTGPHWVAGFYDGWVYAASSDFETNAARCVRVP